MQPRNNMELWPLQTGLQQAHSATCSLTLLATSSIVRLQALDANLALIWHVCIMLGRLSDIRSYALYTVRRCCRLPCNSMQCAKYTQLWPCMKTAMSSGGLQPVGVWSDVSCRANVSRSASRQYRQSDDLTCIFLPHDCIASAHGHKDNGCLAG